MAVATSSAVASVSALFSARSSGDAATQPHTSTNPGWLTWMSTIRSINRSIIAPAAALSGAPSSSARSACRRSPTLLV